MMNRRRALGVLGSISLASLAGCSGASASGSAPDLIWGVHGTKDGWLHLPRAATFDAEDQLYIADLTDRIQVFDRDGNFLRSWRTPSLNIDGPNGLTIDRLGRLLVADTHFYRILIYDRKGTLLGQIGDGVQGEEPGRFVYATDVATDSKGNFVVAEYGNSDRIQVFDRDGKFVRQWGGHGYEPGEFLRVRALAIDKNDHIYTADSCNHRIQVFDINGKLLRAWGSRGPELGQMAYPYDLSLSQDNSIYVVEYGNNRVQKFSTNGKPLGTWGARGRSPGQLNNPWGIAVDSRGAVSVIDSNNHRVQRFHL